MRVAWWLLRPSNALWLGWLLGLLLLYTRRAAWGRHILLVSLLLTLLPVFSPLHHWLARPLEEHLPLPELPEAVDGIVVLGGAVNTVITAARGMPSLNDAAERMTVALRLAQHYPDVPLLFTGGSSALLPSQQHISEAEVARRFFMEAGLDPARLHFEDQSRDTFENARFSYQLMRPEPDQRWLLISSAMHLPRAVGTFQQAGWQVIPYPVDYRSLPYDSWLPRPNVLANFMDIDQALREWLSLIAYRLLGRTATLFP